MSQERRAADRRALRSVGYRGSKSKRNRRPRDQAVEIIERTRQSVFEQIRAMRDASQGGESDL